MYDLSVILIINLCFIGHLWQSQIDEKKPVLHIGMYGIIITIAASFFLLSTIMLGQEKISGPILTCHNHVTENGRTLYGMHYCLSSTNFRLVNRYRRLGESKQLFNF
jgi:hypothetical protein